MPAPSTDFQPLLDALEAAVVHASRMEGPLSKRLRHVETEIERLSPEYKRATDAFVARLDAAKAGLSAPQRGERVTPFLLPDDTGALVSLETLLKSGPVAAVFIRGHWCQFCQTAVTALSDAASDLASMGASVVFITPETRGYTRRLKAQTRTPFPILTDMDNGYAMANQLVIWVDDLMASLLKSVDYDIARYQANPAWMLPIPATLVIDRAGRVADRFIDPDFRRRMEVEETLAALRAAVSAV